MTLVASTKIPASSQVPLVDALAMADLYPLSVEQYQQMIDQGIVPEDSSVELLRGMLVRKDRTSPGEESMGHSPLHRLIISLLTDLAERIKNASRFIQIQLPVICPPYGAPEPDAAVVRGAPRDYSARLPTSRDVFSVIEVAHSSIARDEEDKLPIYAAANIPQYLIVNLNNNTIEIFEDPDPPAGQYRRRATVQSGGRVRLKVGDAEEFEFDAVDVLP
jgi:Uma2 family endonuclease